MSVEKRILIVEDHPDILETFKKNIARAGFVVDSASKREEAFERIRRRAYHVAMIDVNLTDYSGSGDDRSGIDIVRQINSLGEGTKCIVISAERGSEIPVDAHEAGIDKYIIKKRIRAPEDYLGIVRDLAEVCRIRSTGRFNDLIAYLSFPEKRWAWEDQAMRVLKCDAAALPRILDDVFAQYLPVLRLSNASYSLAPASDFKQMSGAFWSRAIARPIWVSIGQKDVELAEPDKPTKTLELLSSRKKGPIHFSVWSAENLSRDHFIGSTGEIG